MRGTDANASADPYSDAQTHADTNPVAYADAGTGVHTASKRDRCPAGPGNRAGSRWERDAVPATPVQWYLCSQVHRHYGSGARRPCIPVDLVGSGQQRRHPSHREHHRGAEGIRQHPAPTRAINPYTGAGADRNPDADAIAGAHSNARTYRNACSNAHAHGDADSHSNSRSNPHPNPRGDPHAYPASHPYTEAHPYTDADAGAADAYS